MFLSCNVLQHLSITHGDAEVLLYKTIFVTLNKSSEQTPNFQAFDPGSESKR